MAENRKTQQPRSRQTAKPARSAKPKVKSPANRKKSKSKPKPLVKQHWFLGASIGLAAVLLLLGVIFFVRVGDQTVKIEIDDPKAQIFINGDQIKIQSSQGTVELKPGEHNLEVRHGNVIVQTKKFEVVNGDNPVLKIHVVPPSEENPKPPVKPLAKPPASVAQSETTPAVKPKPDASSPMVDETQGTEKTSRFINRGAYVEDSKTGLLWQTDGDASSKVNFFQAADYAKALNLGGLTDWRVPTPEELQGIFPATELPFKDTKYTKIKCCEGPYEWNSYWTSLIRGGNSAYLYQWYADGGTNNSQPQYPAYVRCVHDPVNPQANANKSANRQLAEWSIKRGGRVFIETPPSPRHKWVYQTQELPASPFQVLALTLPPKTKVSLDQMQWIGEVKTLMSLSLEDCGVTDDGLRLIAQNPELNDLRVRDNSITDAGMQHLQGLTALKTLWLQGNSLSDAGVQHLSGLAQLEWLDLAKTKITDQGVGRLLPLKTLQILDLRETEITDQAVVGLKTLPNLKNLYLDHTRITNESLQALAGQQTLRILTMGNTKITDAGLVPLSQIRQLESLDLEGCEVTDAGLSAHVTKLKELRILGLSGTKLTDHGLDALSRQLPKLTHLNTKNTAVTPAGLAKYLEAHPKPAPPRSRRRPTRRPPPRPNAAPPKTNERPVYHKTVPEGVDPALYRDVAKWALGRQAMVSYWADSTNSGNWMSASKGVPKEDFVIHSLNLDRSGKVSLEEMQKIAKLQTLMYFRITNAGLTDEGLRLMTQNRSLQEVSINENSLVTDAGLKHLKDLKWLVHLRINGVQLTDAGIKSIEGLSRLETLQVGGTQLTDQSIESILHLEKLQLLELNGTKVTDAGVKRLLALPNLKLLYLNDTKVTDETLKLLAGHKTLILLSLKDTKVTDDGLAYLPRIPQLTSLNLENCQITDQGIMASIPQLKHLNVLVLIGTELTDQGMDALSELPEITNLAVSSTPVTQEAKTRFRKVHPKIFLR